MAGWLTGISTKLGGLLSSGLPTARFGAFGKHPGWNDHFDLGLDSEPMLAAKRYLYLDGIGELIEHGRWKVPPEGEALSEFGHTFFWLDANNFLAGRMWASRDGIHRPRKDYPMIGCVHLSGFGEGSFPDVMHVLEEFEQPCREALLESEARPASAAITAEQVRELLSKAQLRLAQGAPFPLLPPVDRSGHAAALALTPVSEAARRIAYAVKSYLAPLASSGAAIDLKLENSGLHTQHLRLPALGGAAVASARFWQAFLAPSLPLKVPQLYIAPDHAGWIDLIAGIPTTESLFCLKAGSAQLPLASQIPFELSAESIAAADARWEEFLGRA